MALPIPISWVVLLIGVVAANTLTNDQSSTSGLANDCVALLIYGAQGAIRLAWLAAAWRARCGRSRSAWLFADELSVPGRSEPVRCRSPVLIAWLSCAAWPVWVWMWRSTSHDLRALGRAYRVKHLSDLHPTAAALVAIPFGWIPLFRAPRHVWEAQTAAGFERPLNRHIALLAPLWPALCVLLQREVNRLWQAQAMRTDRPNAPIALARMIDPPH